MSKTKYITGKVYSLAMTSMDESIVISALEVGNSQQLILLYSPHELDQAQADFWELRRRKLETYQDVLKGVIRDPDPGF